MSSGIVIIWGFLSTIILVGSCISLNAGNYYDKFVGGNSNELLIKPKLVLRDRTSHNILNDITVQERN